MRMMVFFDLPTETPEDRRNYRKFRKLLVDSGFLMMQESVYCKLLVNTTSEKTVIEHIRKKKPPRGLVQVLTITEKQFSRIELITGEFHSDVVNSDERLVVV